MADQDIHTIWRIFGVGGLIDKLGPDRAIRELKRRCEAGAIVGCTLYRLLIEKWIDVATSKKDSGERAPAEEFMQSAGEDELVKKIEDLHVQYPNGIPRSIRMDVKDEWSEALEKKVGRRIPLDPKDTSKKDIEESKKIAQLISQGEGWPRPLKPKLEPEKKEEKTKHEPQRASAPEEVPPKPIIISKGKPDLELMKKEIQDKINEERKRRARGGGGTAGESKADLVNVWTVYAFDKGEMLYEGPDENKAIKVHDDARKQGRPVKISKSTVDRGRYDVNSGKVNDPAQTNMYSRWTYDDFKTMINHATDIDFLNDIIKHIDESSVMTPGDKVSARQFAEKCKRNIASGTPEIKKQAEVRQAETRLAKATLLRDDDTNAANSFSEYVKWVEKVKDMGDPDQLKKLYTDVDTITTMSSYDKIQLQKFIITRMQDILEQMEKGKPQFPEQFRENGEIKNDDEMREPPEDYKLWTFADFEPFIYNEDDTDELEQLHTTVDLSHKITEIENKELHEMIDKRIDEIESGS